MGRLIDVERVLEPYKILRNTDTLCVATIRQNILECPTVEAIPTPEVRKMLRDCSDEVSDKILDIVKKEYIPKADYENRLKADLVAMLTDLQLKIIDRCHYQSKDNPKLVIDTNVINTIIQQKIDKLKEKK